jgi:hypothetical protein
MKLQQAEKNLILSEKLASYMVKNPDLLGKLPKKASYVVFSLTDKKLNRLNSKLIKGLLKEGKKVVKAEETIDKNQPWILTSITA